LKVVQKVQWVEMMAVQLAARLEKLGYEKVARWGGSLVGARVV
jgi:hypothetical protein